MKKIAFISELYGTKRQGGEHIAMFNVFKSLTQKISAVDFYSYNPPAGQFTIPTSIPLKFLALPFIRDIFFSPLVGKKMLRQFERDYSVVLASTTTLAALYKPHNRLIIVCHAIRSQKFAALSQIPKYKLLFNPLTYWIISRIEKQSFQQAEKIIVIRSHQKDFLINRFGVSEEKIAVIANGVNTALFKPLKVKKKNQVIFVGRGTVPKGLNTLLAAAPQIRAQILIVCQKIDKNLLSIAETLPNVELIFNAAPQKLAHYYYQSKVFILPSLDEEQPLTTLEAMAAGLPVVVTKKAAGNAVENLRNGFIISEKNPNQISKYVNQLLADGNLRKQMGFFNRQKIIQKYNLQDTSEKYLQHICQ